MCTRKQLVRGLNILEEVGENRVGRMFTGLEPNAQGKLLLEFEPAGLRHCERDQVVPQ
jgi:hypothetical protein